MVTDFCELFKNTIRGKYDKRNNSKITKDLTGGATIKTSFNTLLTDYSGDYKATRDYSDEDIQRAMAMHEGDNMPGFPSVDVFIYLMQPQLEKLKEPVIDCLLEVHSYLEGLAHTIIERVFYRFPTLSSEISDIASQVLIKERDKTREIVESIIASEEGYIFTNDLDYLSQRTEIIPKSDGKVRSAENLFVNEIRSRIDSYFKIVIRNVRDSVPKVIGYFLVRRIMDKMQLELYEQINSSESIINHLSEPPHISAERENIKKQLETLRRAEKILKHNPEFAKHTENIAKEMLEQEEQFKREEEEKKNRLNPPKEAAKEVKKDDSSEDKNKASEAKSEQKPVPSKPSENKPVENKNMFGASMFGAEKKTDLGKSNFFK